MTQIGKGPSKIQVFKNTTTVISQPDLYFQLRRSIFCSTVTTVRQQQAYIMSLLPLHGHPCRQTALCLSASRQAEVSSSQRSPSCCLSEPCARPARYWTRHWPLHIHNSVDSFMKYSPISKPDSLLVFHNQQKLKLHYMCQEL